MDTVSPVLLELINAYASTPPVEVMKWKALNLYELSNLLMDKRLELYHLDRAKKIKGKRKKLEELEWAESCKNHFKSNWKENIEYRDYNLFMNSSYYKRHCWCGRRGADENTSSHYLGKKHQRINKLINKMFSCEIGHYKPTGEMLPIKKLKNRY